MALAEASRVSGRSLDRRSPRNEKGKIYRPVAKISGYGEHIEALREGLTKKTFNRGAQRNDSMRRLRR